MATIDIQPLFLSESALTIGEDDFAAHISGARFVPSSSTVTWKGSKRSAVFSKQTAPTWTLVLNYAQDWESAKSLSQYLLAQEGTTVPVTLEPVDGSAGFMADILVTSGEIGGDVDTFGTTTVTLGVSGAPEMIPAV